MAADPEGVPTEPGGGAAGDPGGLLTPRLEFAGRSWAYVESEVRPEKVMNDFKSYASRSLNGLKCDLGSKTLGASWLWKDQDVRDAIRYVIEQQGEML